jgi:hypothetical protein
MKDLLNSNAITTDGGLNGQFIKKLTNEQVNNIIKLTNFCPDGTEIQIRIKMIVNDIKEYPKCVICDNPVRKHNKEFRLLSTCSLGCDYRLRSKITKESNLVNYGTPSTNSLSSVKEKIKHSMLEKHGVSSYTISKDFIKKSEETKTIKYGSPKFVNPDKGKKTKLNKYGDENYNNHDKFIETCIKKYGVEHVMQNKEIFEKQQLNSYGLKKYKHLYYRGTYELLFITEFEKLFDINDLENGFAIKYYNEGKPKIYFPDFIIKSRNKIIEIKSSWTYDNNGKNYLLKMINDNKWEAAEALPNYSFFPLKSKDEIKIFIKML